jgi:hypothetical protein
MIAPKITTGALLFAHNFWGSRQSIVKNKEEN